MKFYLTLYQEEGCLFVNERAIVRLSCMLSGTVFSSDRSNLEVHGVFWRKILKKSQF